MASPTVIEAPGKVVREGPFGGTGGTPFDDGVGIVMQMTITYSAHLIWSVQFGMKDPHGSKGPEFAHMWLCFHEEERLLQVKGTFASVKDDTTDMVTSLTFITSKKTYGPYGAEVGTPFQSSPDGEVVGFFGRSGTYIDAFGTYTYFPPSATDVVLS